jgi:hypothetical protein
VLTGLGEAIVVVSDGRLSIEDVFALVAMLDSIAIFGSHRGVSGY